MKKINKYILLLSLSFSVGCQGFLDLQPNDALPLDTAFKTVADLENGLVGAYDWLQSMSLDLIVAPEIMGGNLDYLGGGSFGPIFLLTMTSSNTRINSFWFGGYRTINQANLLLHALEKVEDPALSTSIANRIKGEALFLRGVVHFEMLRFFALPYGPNAGSDLGIPLMLESTATTDELNFPVRASVAEVYQQVIADLMEASQLLPDFIDRGRANRDVALGYLSKVAFQQRDYNRAAELAGQVMSSPYELTTRPVDFFRNEGSEEEIWVVIYTTQDYGNLAPLLAPDAPSFFINEELKQQVYPQVLNARQQETIANANLMANDLRVTTLTATDTTKVNKYEEFDLWGDDAPLLRLAEIFLIRAESLARTEGINEESIGLLNAIRQRALRITDTNENAPADWMDYISYQSEDFNSADELIEAIILERRVELAFEGNYFHDLMRLQRDVQSLPFDDDRLRWPIPQRETDVNRNLIQNPGY